MSIRMTVEDKGIFVENIIINMFIGSGRKVFHNGIEKTNADFYHRFNERKKRGDKISYDPRLRQMMSKPDLIVECVDGEYDFAEVKFRSIQHLPENNSIEWLFKRIQLEKHFETCSEFWKPEIILVTNKPLETGNFMVLSYPYVKKTENVTQLNFKALGDVEKWGIRSDIIKQYEEIITKTFAD